MRMNVSIPAYAAHFLSCFLFHCNFTLPLLQHFLHTASGSSAFIYLHLHGQMWASSCIGELTWANGATCYVAHLGGKKWSKKTQKQTDVLWHIPIHEECLTDLWVSRNLWGKHLYQSGNRTVPRWQCYNSVMSFVNCAKVTISRRRLLLLGGSFFPLFSVRFWIISFRSCWQPKRINAVLVKGEDRVVERALCASSPFL